MRHFKIAVEVSFEFFHSIQSEYIKDLIKNPLGYVRNITSHTA